MTAEHGELVAALLGVPGVAAAAVEATDGGPGTLRLQLAPGVDEVGVAGEVNHLLRSRFGLAVDTDRVRVVDPGADRPVAAGPHVAREAERDLRGEHGSQDVRREDVVPNGRPAPGAPAVALGAEPPSGRVVIERVQLVSAGLGTSVVVVLGAGGRSYEGTAEGTATSGSLNRAVASATLRALELVVAGRVRFDVEHVELAETGTDRTALVVLTMVTERATQRLSGASVVREDARQAVIRAVLAATNRRLTALDEADDES